MRERERKRGRKRERVREREKERERVREREIGRERVALRARSDSDRTVRGASFPRRLSRRPIAPTPFSLVAPSPLARSLPPRPSSYFRFHGYFRSSAGPCVRTYLPWLAPPPPLARPVPSIPICFLPASARACARRVPRACLDPEDAARHGQPPIHRLRMGSASPAT